MKLAALIPLLLLAGCVKVGEQRSAMPVQQGPALANTPPRIELEPRSEGELLARVEQFRSETQASNNATQQSLTGLGVQVSKVAENVKVTGAEITSSIKSEVQATAMVNANLRAQLAAELRAEIRNEMKASLDAQANLNAALAAKFEALTAGQAGLHNELQQTSQTITASGNAHVKTIQFSQEHLAAFAVFAQANVSSVYWLCGGMVTVVSLLSVMQSRTIARMAALAETVDTDPSKKETKRL